MLVLGGLILCSLGVLGEYAGRIFEQVKRRPVYLLKESNVAAAGRLARPADLSRRRVRPGRSFRPRSRVRSRSRLPAPTIPPYTHKDTSDPGSRGHAAMHLPTILSRRRDPPGRGLPRR